MLTAVKETSESGFSWELIAKQVKSRTGVQCLRKWYKKDVQCSQLVVIVKSETHCLRNAFLSIRHNT